MKIPANASTAYLRKIIAELRDELIKFEISSENLQSKLAAAAAENIAYANSKVDRMGERKPWKLAALAFVTGIGVSMALTAVF